MRRLSKSSRIARSRRSGSHSRDAMVIGIMRLLERVLLAAPALCLWAAAAADPVISWSTQPVVLESEVSTWARMVQLPDGSWLAAYTIFKNPTIIRVKRSIDRMRTWTRVTEVAEDGRNLDNA